MIKAIIEFINFGANVEVNRWGKELPARLQSKHQIEVSLKVPGTGIYLNKLMTVADWVEIENKREGDEVLIELKGHGFNIVK